MKAEMSIADCLRTYEVPRRGIIHVGAGFCEEGAMYKELGFERVIWVEALPDEQERRQAAAAELGQTLILAALDDRPRRGVDFHVMSNSYSSSLLPLGTHQKLYPEVLEDRVIQIDTVSGEAFLRDHPEAAACNVLMIDVQGAELRVLQGFRYEITRFDCVFSEVYLDEVYDGCGKLEDADFFLSRYGFLRVETWIKPHEGWGDAFWIKKSLL